MEKQILKTFLIMIIFLMLPNFASAATGDILFSCTFDGAGSTPAAVVANCGGNGNSMNNSATIVTGGHDGGKAVSYYYPNTGDEVGDGFDTPYFNKRELTVEYWEKFDVDSSASHIWNVKSIRPYVGPTPQDYMAAFISLHDGGMWYQAAWGAGTGTLTTTSKVNSVEIDPVGYCTGSSSPYNCFNSRLQIRWTPGWGTSWHKIRAYMKTPSNTSTADGIVKLWIDDALVYTLSNIKPDTDWFPYTKYIAFHPSDDFYQRVDGNKFPFHHFYDDITVYDGLVAPGSVTDTTAPTTTASPAGGTYTSIQNITLSANETVTIYYTTDGSTPTTSSTQYSSPINISATTILKYFAKDAAGNSETPKTQTYTINTPGDAEAPTTPTNLTAVATSPTSIQLNWEASSDNVGVVKYEIQMLPDHYSISTTNSKLWTYAVSPGTQYSFRVWAVDAADNYSTPTDYVIATTSSDTTAPTTTASPSGGTFTSAQNITLSANEPATIYYITDGSTPTTASIQYSSPINISATTTLKYFAKDTAGNSEAPKSLTYTINIPVTYNLSNLLTLVTNWLKVGTVSDVNSDNIVDTRDLGIMMSKWN